MSARLTLLYREPDGREFTHGHFDWMAQARREFERLSRDWPIREWTLVRFKRGKPVILRQYKPSRKETKP